MTKNPLDEPLQAARAIRDDLGMPPVNAGDPFNKPTLKFKAVPPVNIYDDPQTVQPDEIARLHPEFASSVLGHFYNGPDGFVYQVIGFRKNDGPWIEEVLGRTKTRTISIRAIDRTFHHHDKCAVHECRAHGDVESAIRWSGGLSRTVEWSGCEQSTDGTTIWVNAPDGMCIGRLSPKGIDIHGNARQQGAGEHCLHCEPGSDPFGNSVSFQQYVRFVEKMKEHHGVQVSRALPIRITTTPRMLVAR